MEFKLDLSENSREEAIGRFAESLISSGAVNRIFMSQYDEKGEAVYGTVVSDENGLEHAAPLAPYLIGNKGREAGMAVPKNSGIRTAVFLRPCEARALVELSKLNKAHRESILLVTCDCPGTLSLDDYKRFRQKYPEAKESIDSFYSAFHKGERLEEFTVRDCCTYCDSLVHPNSDIRMLFVGAGEGEIIIQSSSEAGEKALSTMGTDGSGAVDEAVRGRFAESQSENRKKFDEEWAAEIKSIDDLMSLLTHCRRCYNCRAECPICYCRECVFQTPTFEVTPDTFARRADHFGAIKMPPDTLLFHLTRLNHMVSSCVACGQCTEACPQGIPVGRIFAAVAKQVQDLFEYHAGADPAEELPLTIYKEDELEPR